MGRSALIVRRYISDLYHTLGRCHSFIHVGSISIPTEEPGGIIYYDTLPYEHLNNMNNIHRITLLTAEY